MNTNYTTQTASEQLAKMTWMVDCSGEVVETETHDAVKLALRDRDGKFAPQAKPVSRKQAMAKLTKDSQRLNAAIDRMMDMENW